MKTTIRTIASQIKMIQIRKPTSLMLKRDKYRRDSIIGLSQASVCQGDRLIIDNVASSRNRSKLFENTDFLKGHLSHDIL